MDRININGVMAINKPSGMTSFDVVSRVRKILKIKKIGHCGTLDPLATGVLPLLFGKATKALPFILEDQKDYIASFKLGIISDTQDITGKITKIKTGLFAKKKSLEKNIVKNALKNFLGNSKQIPPMYSALKKNGKRLYSLARRGKEIEREPRKIFIKKIFLVDFDEKNLEGQFFISCSKGTYVRTICHDLGKKIRCGAVMTALHRTFSSGFCIEDSISLKNLEKQTKNNTNILRKIDTMFFSIEKITVTAAQALRFKNGGSLFLERLTFMYSIEDGKIIRVYDQNKSFLGLGKVSIKKGEMLVLKNF
ncbi:MAG: tRNA pseudouridine(55) synthase TruB [Oscillospiraceae bacterium]|jgi:tRNA pseudouridine55 synthase|nr:tRNA pseudouridine(55) synthase TruB [Oscillospiraceae bacterium]